jgi:diguanylate cyclase (GGDEF)-like protein
VGAVACLAALGVGAALAAIETPRKGSLTAFAVVTVLAAVISWFPLERTGSGGARTQHLVEMPVTAGLLLLDPRRALVAYVVGTAISWMLSGRAGIKQVFGIAEHAVAASVAVLVFDWLERLDLPGPARAYVPVALGCYFVVNSVLNSLVYQLAALRRRDEPFFVDLGPTALGGLLAMVTGGVVGLLGQAGPAEVLVATVPVGIVLTLCKAYAERGRRVDLLQGVVAAVADTHAGMSTAEVETAVCQRVVQVLDCPRAVIRRMPPIGSELGVPVDGKGPQRWLVAEARPVEPYRPEETDLLRALAGVAARALENASLQEQLARQALHDPLTGAPNRRLLTFELEGALARARRTGDRVGVAFLDLTEFKVVNDALGHDAGDELLTMVAERLALSVRTGDLVGRFGGDEFVIVFPTLDDAAMASVGRRVLSAFEQPFLVKDEAVTVHCNIGLATWPADGDTAEELLRRADAAMYRAKRVGGNTIAYAVPS